VTSFFTHQLDSPHKFSFTKVTGMSARAPPFCTLQHEKSVKFTFFKDWRQTPHTIYPTHIYKFQRFLWSRWSSEFTGSIWRYDCLKSQHQIKYHNKTMHNYTLKKEFLYRIAFTCSIIMLYLVSTTNQNWKNRDTTHSFDVGS